VSIDFRQLLEASPNPYMLVDRELRYVWANRAYLEVTGSELSALVGRDLFALYPNDPDDPGDRSQQLLRASLQKVLATGERDVIAYIPYRVARTPGGPPELRIWSATHSPIVDERGDVVQILQHTQDVTELHRAGPAAASVLGRAEVLQRRLVEIDERMQSLQAMLGQAPGFLAFLRGPEHVFELANAAYERLVGRSGLIGKTVREALPDLEGQGYHELLDRVYTSGEPVGGRGWRVELARTPDGELEDVYVDFLFQPMVGADGAMLGIIVQGHEVTEHKRTTLRQRFLTRASELLATAADDLDRALLAVADAAVETYADLAFIDLFEPEGARRLTVAHADPAHAELARAMMRFPLPSSFTEGHVLRDMKDKPGLVRRLTEEIIVGAARGPEHAALLRASGIRSVLALPLCHRGRLYGAVTLATAQSRRHYDESDLPAMEELGRVAAAALDNARLSRERAALLASEQAARERAEAANRTKDEFLAILGHELRNPLAPILTAVQLMRMRGDTQSKREQEIIERQARHLVRLLDDLLDVSRITRGKIELRRAPVELATVAAKAIEIAGPLLEQKGHMLTVDVPPRGLRVDGDETRLAQVVANLLTNAARYTPRGGRVWLRAGIEGGAAVVRVRDDGIGVEPEMLGKIFDLFVQAPQTSERAEGGLGLGLTLVRRLVEMHGGTVVAESRGLGYGAEVIVRLPALADAEAPASERAADPRGPDAVARSVLVVDDNADAALLLSDLLRRRGHRTRVAHDGEEALRIARDEPPEVAIVDLGLPTMTGYELASRLRAELGSRAPQLIALTGYGAERDRALSRELGFTAHCTKPVDSAALLRLIERRPG
jgi:PAS domain S-box-containing protein